MSWDPGKTHRHVLIVIFLVGKMLVFDPSITKVYYNIFISLFNSLSFLLVVQGLFSWGGEKEGPNTLVCYPAKR